MLEGLHPFCPLSSAAAIQTSAPALLAAAGQQLPSQQQPAGHAFQPLAGAVQRPGLPAAAAAASSISAGSSSLEALLLVGCSRREAEVAWDLTTLWRLMRLGCDPALGQYYLPLQHYTRQPALIVRLQACKSEKQLAKYVVRLVHAFRKAARRGSQSPPQPHPGASVEQGVQLMNQLLRLLAERGLGGGPEPAPGAALPAARPPSPAAGALQLALHQQLAAVAQQQQEQQQQAEPGLAALLYAQPPADAAPGPGALWGHEVVMGMPHAVLLEGGAAEGLPVGDGARDLGEAESTAVASLHRADSIRDFLS